MASLDMTPTDASVIETLRAENEKLREEITDLRSKVKQGNKAFLRCHNQRKVFSRERDAFKEQLIQLGHTPVIPTPQVAKQAEDLPSSFLYKGQRIQWERVAKQAEEPVQQPQAEEEEYTEEEYGPIIAECTECGESIREKFDYLYVEQCDVILCRPCTKKDDVMEKYVNEDLEGVSEGDVAICGTTGRSCDNYLRKCFDKYQGCGKRLDIMGCEDLGNVSFCAPCYRKYDDEYHKEFPHSQWDSEDEDEDEDEDEEISPIKKRLNENKGLTKAKSALKVMKAVDDPERLWKVKEIVEAMEQDGYIFGKDKGIYNTLHTHPETFEKVKKQGETLSWKLIDSST